MKKFIIILLLTYISADLLAQNSTAAAPPQTKPANDKAFLISYFDKTAESLKQSVAGLSPAQLHFKPSPEKWSISQCLEHIVMTENALFDFAKKGVDAPANPERRAEIKMTDDGIITSINDRSYKATATNELIGTGKYTRSEDALDDLIKGRRTVLAYVNAKSLDDLRNHISDSPFGAVDGYQTFLFLAGHTSRHTAQIAEIKADKQFPAK